MPTVIDSLAVTLALDPSQFTRGQKQAATAFNKTKEEATKAGKGIEAASDKAAESLDRLARNALKLFAIFTAGRAVKDFVADITGADAALGRLAQRIGQAPSDISALATAVQRSGGSFEGAAGSFQRFSDSIQELKATGNTSILPFLYRVQAAGGKTVNLNKDISATFVDVADNLKRINDTQGAATANYYGKQLGIDEGTVALLVQGGDAVKKYMEESRKLGSATKEDIEAAQRYQRAMARLNQTMDGLGRAIMTTVSPMLVEAINYMQKWIMANKAWIQTEIVGRIKAFADYIRGIDWKAVEEGIKSFISGANDAAKAVGGWKTVAELFFGLWAASKMASIFAPILGSIATVRLALMRLGPIGWALLGVGSVGAALAEADPNKAIVSGGKNPTGSLNPGDELPGLGSEHRSPSGGAGIRARAARARGASAATEAGAGGGSDGQSIVTHGHRWTPGATGSGKERVASWLSFFQKPVAEGGMGADAGTARAMVAMMQGESGANLNPGSIGTAGEYGTAQWHLERRTALLRKAASMGKPWQDVGVQQQHWRDEALFGKQRATWNAIKNEPDEYRKLRIGVYRFEAPKFKEKAYDFRKPNLDVLRRNAQQAKPSAWNGYPGASDAIAAAHSAQAANIQSRTMNDNRSTSTSQSTFNGGIHVNTAATSGDGIAAELQDSIRRKSFATAANYGQA